MSEQQAEHEPVDLLEAVAQEPEGETPHEAEPAGEATDEDHVKKLREESRTYRQRIAEVKTESVALKSLAEVYVRQAIEGLVADRLSRPGLLWELGEVSSPFDLLTDDNKIDLVRLDAAVKATLTHVPEAATFNRHHGHLGPRKVAKTKPTRAFGDVSRGDGR